MTCYAVVNAMLHPDLKPNEARLYAYLTFRANGERVTWPSVPEMQLHCHLDRATVLRATKRLAELGLIEVTRRYRDRNLYRIAVVNEDRPDFAPVRNDAAEEVAKPAPQEAPAPEVAEYAHQDPERSQNAHISGRKIRTSAVAKCAQESSNKNPTRYNKEEGCFAAAAPEPTLPLALPPAVNDRVPTKDTVPDRYWNGDGRRIVRKLTGCSHSEASKTLGKFRSIAAGNLAAVLDALLAAERDDIPGHALWGYVTSGIQARLTPRPTFSTPAGQICEALGLNTPEKRREFQQGLTVDYSAFEREAAGD